MSVTPLNRKHVNTHHFDSNCALLTIVRLRLDLLLRLNLLLHLSLLPRILLGF